MAEGVALQSYMGYLESLVPLKSIKSSVEIDMLADMGYCEKRCFTPERFKSLFPKVSQENIFYTKSEDGDYAYYDEQHCIYVPFRTSLALFSKEYQSEFSAMPPKMLRRFEKRDYIYLLSNVPAGVEIELLERLIGLVEPSSELYDCFTFLYQSRDFGFKNIPLSVMKRALSGKSRHQRERTERALLGFGEVVLLYRGEAENSRYSTEAFSWTTSINIANYFASRSGVNGRILMGCARKEDILEYFDEDLELEAIVLPKKVRVTDTLELMGLKQLSETILNSKSFAMRYKRMREVLLEVYSQSLRSSADHDALHSLRVLFLGLVLGLHEGYEEQVLEGLAWAAVFHDTGRTNDCRDEMHGAQSAKLFLCCCENYGCEQAYAREIAFAIRAHCIGDERAVREMPSYALKRPDLALSILKLLKDADALDRVRFGIRALDIRYLRHPFAERLTPLARQLKDELSL